MLDITLLGTGGMMPLKGRWLTAAMLRCQGKGILVDCGEGTQIAMREAELSPSGVDMICFTHYHGDHINGLPGLLMTMANSSRLEPVWLIGPEGLERYVSSLCITAQNLPFELRLLALQEGEPQTIDLLPPFRITAFPAEHTTPCFGYTFEIPRAGRFDVEKARRNDVPMSVWSQLQRSETAADSDGRVYTRSMVMGEDRRGLKAVYSTDTRPTAALREQITNADLAIIEGMFGSDEKQERAIETGHMTFTEAARLCAQAQPTEAWLTHYSPSVGQPEEFLSAAQEIFPAIICGCSAMSRKLTFAE